MTWLSFALLVLKVMMELPALIEAIRKIWDAINGVSSNVQKREMRSEAAVILRDAYKDARSSESPVAIVDHGARLTSLAAQWERTHNVA